VEVPQLAGRDGKKSESEAKVYFEKELSVSLAEREIWVDVGSERIPHKVDLATEDLSILIECKSYTFTASGKEPSHKLEQAKADALLLALSSAKRKILIFDDDEHPRKGSLARLFERRNRSVLGRVEVWRHWQGTFEKVTSRP
jgi:hypothetical protein